MKVKTSITLSMDLLKEIDTMTKEKSNRSAFIEAALRSYLKKKRKEIREKKDFDILNKVSDKLNKEANDVLSWQVEI